MGLVQYNWAPPATKSLNVGWEAMNVENEKMIVVVHDQAEYPTS